MKLKHKQQLKSLIHHKHKYGYIALKDYRTFHHLKSLDKIIKLKSANRILCARRKSMIKSFHKLYSGTIQGVDIKLLSDKTHKDFINSISLISERIGRNSNKIQRLRSEYLKYSDKWIDSVVNKR